MALNDLLSQDEIDALMDAVVEGEVNTDGESVPTPAAEAFDFASPARVIHGFLPTLEMINERFLHGFRLSLFNLTQQYAEVTAGGIQVLGLSEYMSTLSTPTSINLVRVKPLRGTGLVVFEPHLVSTVVNAFFGGSGRIAARGARAAFTGSELRIVQRLLAGVCADLRAAWSTVMHLEFESLRSESNPRYATVLGAGDTEPMVVNVIKVALEGGDGAVHVLMPYSMFEPLRERLSARIQHPSTERDTRFHSGLLEGLGEAEVAISSTLLHTELSLQELLQLKTGDIIPVHIPSDVTLDVEQLPVLRGVHGSLRGSSAVRVTGTLQRS